MGLFDDIISKVQPKEQTEEKPEEQVTETKDPGRTEGKKMHQYSDDFMDFVKKVKK